MYLNYFVSEVFDIYLSIARSVQNKFVLYYDNDQQNPLKNNDRNAFKKRGLQL